MRILHVRNGVPGTGNGIANVAVDLALEQRHRSHAVAVAFAGGGFVPLLRDHSVTHHDIEFRRRSPAALVHSYRRLAATLREEDPHIVRAHSLTPSVLAFVATRLRKSRLIVTVHGQYQRGSEPMRPANRVVVEGRCPPRWLVGASRGRRSGRSSTEPSGRRVVPRSRHSHLCTCRLSRSWPSAPSPTIGTPSSGGTRPPRAERHASEGVRP